jgi:hypothetical protein
MPEKERERLLSVLIPARFLEMFSIDPETYVNPAGERCVRFTCPESMPFFQIDLRRNPADRDAAYFLDLSNSAFGQMEISFIIVNDPDGERYNIDVDEYGQDTYFGTARRNLPEEIRAMDAGLAPAQVRRGLRAMRDLVACWDDFIGRVGHRFYFLEPLTYNSAILYERCGFQYVKGKEKMEDRPRVPSRGRAPRAAGRQHSVPEAGLLEDGPREELGDPRRHPRRAVGKPQDV